MFAKTRDRRLQLTSELLRNEKGLSLLESLAGLSVIGIVCFGFLAWVNLYGQNVTNLNQTEAVNNAMIEITSAFGGDDRYCTAILGDLPFSAQPSGTSVNKIEYHNLKGEVQGVVAQLNDTLKSREDLLISQIRLKPVVTLDTLQILAQLEITFHKKSASPGAQDIVRQIPIHTTLKDGKIVSCSTSPATALIMNSRLCEIKSDGFSHYDPETGECVDNENVKWFVGPTPYSASCPTGYSPAVSKLREDPQTIACDAIANNEMQPLPPRIYANGYIDDSILQIWRARAEGTPFSTCIFAYEEGVSVANTQGRIKCVKN